MFQRLAAQRLLALFVFGWLMFTFPLLGLWNVDASVFGIPLLPAALFAIWAVLIGLVAWTVERSEGMD